MSAPLMCLLYVVDDAPSVRRVLLGQKHTGFGVGRVVGLGGHVEPGETAVEATVREAREEVGIELLPHALNPVGLVKFRFPEKPEWDQDVAVFTASEWSGEPVPSEEITPAWYDVEAIPFDKMWDDAHHWLPTIIEGGHVDLTVTFKPDNRTVASTS